LLAIWKWLLSFRKSEWTISDYPIRFATQEPDPEYKAPRFSQHTHRAYILRGAITGSGNTREEAFAALAQNFDSVTQRRRLEEKPAVRPGLNWPIEFASQDMVSSDDAFSEEFIQKVLDLEWAWISDGSSLWDFHTEETNDLLYVRIREVYGVDVSDIKSGKLREIFERIKLQSK
jgi:hypothetical protein